jgi:tetratricopeptide (TPR) repeat protein
MMNGVPVQERTAVFRFLRGVAALLAFASAAAGCATANRAPSAAAPLSGDAVSRRASAWFDSAMRASSEHDRRGDWQAADCTRVARQFRDAWGADPALREALFNASVAELRCHLEREPRQQQLTSVAMRPRADPGALALTPLAWRRAPAELERALVLANSTAAAAPDPVNLAALAALHIERGYWSADPATATQDFLLAQGQLESALTVDERSAAARTELALLHLARAKQASRQADNPTRLRSNGRRALAGDAAAPELERALGLALQVVREHPTYAPARNALGLVSYELRDTLEAARQFALATSYAPGDAEMFSNLGGALLSAGDFAGAEQAYERAIELSSDAYEAHLGRALALGAQIDAVHRETQLDRVQRELDRCKQLAPERPEAYYNEAWLTLDWKVGPQGDLAKAAVSQAGSLLDTFLAKAGMAPAYSQQVRSARAKLGELRKLEQLGR